MDANLKNNEVNSLSVADFEGAFGETLSPYVAERVRNYLFQYVKFTAEENEQLII
jgi:hypothetical protein